jgi:gluconokinase
MLILALDLGTSSCRSALFDHTGQRLVDTTAQRSYPLITDRSGKAELDPATVLKSLIACIDTTLTTHKKNKKLSALPIHAVGTSCFLHSSLGVDAAGKPVSPIITWADSRCRAQAEALRARNDENNMHERSGCMLRASFWPARFTWLKQQKFTWTKKVAHYLAPSEWLLLQFCGEIRSAHAMATGTGLYNPRLLNYDKTLLRLAGLAQHQLPPVSDEPLHLLPQFAKRWPALRDAHWFPGIGDSSASNLGSGATQPGCAAINVGTSAAVRVMRSTPSTPQAPYGLFCYRVDSERFLIGGAISNAGNLRAWCLRELRLPDNPEVIEAALAKNPTATHGLQVLPFWTAERAPDWREDVSGSVVGITQATTALDLLQAITEASYHRLAIIVEHLPDNKKLRYIVGGGIQKSRSSLQRLADVLNRPLTVLDEPEASLRGAAVFALEKLGYGAHLRSVTGRTVKPHAQRAKHYAAERARMCALETAIFPAQKSPSTSNKKRAPKRK